MSFNQKRFDNYHTKNWLHYEKILKSNGNILEHENEVGVDGWTALDDWKFGDVIWNCNGVIANADLKTCGRFDGAVKITQLINNGCKVDYFDFYDVIKRCVYRVSRKNLKELYDKNKWYQAVNKESNTDDKRDGLARFETEIIKNNSTVLM